jgi:hypothetical protein
MTAYMSKSIDLSGYSSATLSFWHTIPSIEDGYDHARVFIDSNLVYEVSTEVLSWSEQVLSLDAYVGDAHMLTFEFQSDVSVQYEGWYLDDILLTAEPILPDAYEPNDSFEGAYDLGTRGNVVVPDLTIHAPSNHDWFRFTAGGTGHADVNVYFSHAAGDIDLYVYDASLNYVGASTSADDNEFVPIEQVVAGQGYYVQVFGSGGATNPNYSLEIIAPDIYEPNDSFAAAYNLATRDYFYDAGLTIHAPYNDDWFRFTAGDTGPAHINVYFTHAAGDIDLYVYDASQAQIGSSTSADDDESVSIDQVVGGQTYYVQVVGYGGATSPYYSLQIIAPSPPLDIYEPNDSFETAYNLGGMPGYFSTTGLTIHAPGNDDWVPLHRGSHRPGGHQRVLQP